MKHDNYIAKWLNDSLTNAEKAAFEQSEEFKSLARLSDALLQFKAPRYDVEAELARVELQKAPETKVVRLDPYTKWMRVAAVLLVLISTFFYFYVNRYVTAQTSGGERAEIYLPDSSKVLLNAMSVIRYKPYFWKSDRKVMLEGEAYFEVAKGSRFDVETEAGTTSVLGTRFDVKQREAYFEVICFEGLVGVASHATTVKLEPGHGIRVINDEVIMLQAENKNAPGWIGNESFFQSVPYIEVIREFERQYNRTISADGIDMSQLYTGTFSHNDITLALNAITIPMNLTWKTGENGNIMLQPKGE